jgi:hypothetical protein
MSLLSISSKLDFFCSQTTHIINESFTSSLSELEDRSTATIASISVRVFSKFSAVSEDAGYSCNLKQEQIRNVLRDAEFSQITSPEELQMRILDDLLAEAHKTAEDATEPSSDYPIFLNLLNAKNQAENDAIVIEIIGYLEQIGSLNTSELTSENASSIDKALNNFVSNILIKNPDAFLKILENYKSDTPSILSKSMVEKLSALRIEEIRKFDHPKENCISKIQQIFKDIFEDMALEKAKFEDVYPTHHFSHNDEIIKATIEIAYVKAGIGTVVLFELPV